VALTACPAAPHSFKPILVLYPAPVFFSFEPLVLYIYLAPEFIHLAMKCIFAFFVFTESVCNEQDKDPRTSNYSKMPYWIEMIKNPNVNYYEAVTAYEEFWKGRNNPLNETTFIQDTQAVNNSRQTNSIKKERLLYLKYLAECKKFENWRSTVKPYVQPDGRISKASN
jgi:hypothetical protein